MNVVGKVLKYVGGLWLVFMLARLTGRIEAGYAVFGLWEAVAMFNWISFVANVVPAAAFIWVGMWLESRHLAKSESLSHLRSK